MRLIQIWYSKIKFKKAKVHPNLKATETIKTPEQPITAEPLKTHEKMILKDIEEVSPQFDFEQPASSQPKLFSSKHALQRKSSLEIVHRKGKNN